MLKVEIDLQSIRDNYQILARAAGVDLMPVVKADAYGHGMEQVAMALWKQGARYFAVGPVFEGLILRSVLPEAGIFSLMGPLNDNDVLIIRQKNIIPFIHSWEQLQLLSNMDPHGSPLPVGLKFDTGMNRLGFKCDQVGLLIDFLQNNPKVNLTIISSHLALADDPLMNHQVIEQWKCMQEVSDFFNQAGFIHQKTMANSAAILNVPETIGDIARPGIALYGGNPFTGTCCEGKGDCLKQAMRVKAPVLSVSNLLRGEGISYGLTFVAPRNMRVAIIGCGYADNYSRSLSNKSWMIFKGHMLPVLGRVCMQMSAVDVSHVPDISPEDEVFVLGGDELGEISVHQLAFWWNTISYEVFCLLGKNEKVFIHS
ncbi:alanine racemase [Desulfonatronovibrio magnus]|uniref:alanine racemase n=1 Tax=Desulfonatronovibrio magnus TaxID=698827 RepID=UPI0005EB6838|nr:alanine racemase [Desulfonatronovibrio magnus]